MQDEVEIEMTVDFKKQLALDKQNVEYIQGKTEDKPPTSVG